MPIVTGSTLAEKGLTAVPRSSLRSAARKGSVKLRAAGYAERNNYVKRLVKEIIHDLGRSARLATGVFFDERTACGS